MRKDRQASTQKYMLWGALRQTVVGRTNAGCPREHQGRLSWETPRQAVMGSTKADRCGEHQGRLSWGASWQIAMGSTKADCRGEHHDRLSRGAPRQTACVFYFCMFTFKSTRLSGVEFHCKNGAGSGQPIDKPWLCGPEVKSLQAFASLSKCSQASPSISIWTQPDTHGNI